MSKVPHLVTSSIDAFQRPISRAAALRLLALECHAVAETFSTAETRAQMHKIAQSYERRARDHDQIAEHQGRIARA